MSEAFSLSEEQQLVLEAADRYARDRIAPLARRMDDEEWWPDKEFRELGKNGYFGITVPPELGGAGLDLWTSGLVLQAFSRWNPAFALSWVAHENLCLNNIYRNANETLRHKYLPSLCAGKSIGALGLTEPGAGSDALGAMSTTARRNGDRYILNGRKMFITNGPVADVLLVYAKTSPDKGPHGISAFIVEKDFSGFSVAQKLTKMGFRGSQTGELLFDDCEVPAENLVGTEDEGVAVVMSGLDLERAVISPICVGMAERALEIAIEYAKTREQFGVVIGSFQALKHRAAKVFMEIELCRSSVMAAANAADDGDADLTLLVSLAKARCSDAFILATNESVQMYAGIGMTDEHDAGFYLKRARVTEMTFGDTAWHRDRWARLRGY